MGIDGAFLGLLKEAGPWVAFGLSVISGLLIPRGQHRERINDYKSQVEKLEKALQHEKSINDMHAQTLSKLLVYAESNDKILEALYSATKKGAAT